MPTAYAFDSTQAQMRTRAIIISLESQLPQEAPMAGKR